MTDNDRNSQAEPMESRESEQARCLADIADLQQFLASLPDQDSRSPEEIIGYDEFGLPN